MTFPFQRLGKFLKCQKCGEGYPYYEFVEIAKEVGTGKVGFPEFGGLLVCLACWRLKFPNPAEVKE